MRARAIPLLFLLAAPTAVKAESFQFQADVNKLMVRDAPARSCAPARHAPRAAVCS